MYLRIRDEYSPKVGCRKSQSLHHAHSFWIMMRAFDADDWRRPEGCSMLLLQQWKLAMKISTFSIQISTLIMGLPCGFMESLDGWLVVLMQSGT